MQVQPIKQEYSLASAIEKLTDNELTEFFLFLLFGDKKKKQYVLPPNNDRLNSIKDHFV